jgi:hypothetical protein
MSCPECNTKLRKYKFGKFSAGSKVYDENIKAKISKRLCPICQTPPVSICMCPKAERTCINDHKWSSSKQTNIGCGTCK